MWTSCTAGGKQARWCGAGGQGDFAGFVRFAPCPETVWGLEALGVLLHSLEPLGHYIHKVVGALAVVRKFVGQAGHLRVYAKREEIYQEERDGADQETGHAAWERRRPKKATKGSSMKARITEITSVMQKARPK
jgi:hypothetical protein